MRNLRVVQLFKPINDHGIIKIQKEIQGKIQNIKDNTITFNLGKQHGIKKGQSFALAHKSFFTDEDGGQQPYIITSSNHVRVNQVYNRSAIAKSIGDELLANIQTSDIVLLIELEETEL